jgi:hypothetical protein
MMLAVELSTTNTTRLTETPRCLRPRSGATAAQTRSKISSTPLTQRQKRLQENVGAAAIELTEGDLRNIEDVASQITVLGHRYSESSERMVDR